MIKEKFKYYFANLLLIWPIVALYKYLPYYVKILSPETLKTIFILASAYTILGFFYYLFIPLEKASPTKGIIILRFLRRFPKEIYNYLKNPEIKEGSPVPKIEQREKVIILFLLVKIFFLPIMLNFTFANYASIKDQVSNLPPLQTLLNINSFNAIVYSLCLPLLFFIDTIYFSFGYAFEAKFLQNTIRSVEPTLFGWAVTLVCYPPFNGMFSKYVSWHANDFISFKTETITFAVRIIILLLLAIYVWATVALGTRASNLTNRGIVSWGPYAYIRHPAYICKNLIWWVTIIPVMSITAFLAMSVWSVIYFFRAVTEERHLGKDPDYQKYCKKVKYKFIPYIW